MKRLLVLLKRLKDIPVKYNHSEKRKQFIWRIMEIRRRKSYKKPEPK